MKRFLLYSLVVVALAGAAAGYLAYAKLGALVKLAVETVGPKVTGAVVRLDRAQLSPLSGKGRLSGLFIGNPKGFRTESAFKLHDVAVSVDLKSLASDCVKVHEVLVDGPEITMELAKGGSNLARLQKNVESSAPASSQPEAKASEPAGKELKLEVGLFKVTNAKLHLSMGVLHGKDVTVPLPDIELRNIGRDKGGASVKETVAVMLGAVTRSAMNAAAGAGGLLKDGAGVLRGAGKSAASGASKLVKGIFGGKKD
ncbi:MAG: hypothetical protein HY924_04610 [Elusimicrobia bacterium]|nr:hypothetical protein [Elusimicrobiota bacterium]